MAEFGSLNACTYVFESQQKWSVFQYFLVNGNDMLMRKHRVHVHIREMMNGEVKQEKILKWKKKWTYSNKC